MIEGERLFELANPETVDIPYDVMNRRNFVLGLSASAGVACVLHREKAESHYQLGTGSRFSAAVVKDNLSLGKRGAARNILYGAATQKKFLASDPLFRRHFEQNCSILVPIKALKWNFLRPSLDLFDFSDGDWLADFAAERGMAFRGHTLVWHEGLPDWFQSSVNPLNAEQILTDHIKKVASHYAGKVHSWDVVNEAVFPRDGRSDGLRNSPWLKMLGPKYIDLAFRTAAAADPKARLVYNEHGLTYDNTGQNRKRDAVLALLERLVSAGVPIHALGIQAHLLRVDAQFSAEKLRLFLKAVASLGLEIMITELDVTDTNLATKASVRDQQIADVYWEYLSVVLQEPAVTTVLTWGLSDRYTWLKKEAKRTDGEITRPLPLDQNMNRKLAWYAIADSFDNAALRVRNRTES